MAHGYSQFNENSKKLKLRFMICKNRLLLQKDTKPVYTKILNIPEPHKALTISSRFHKMYA